MASSGKKKTTMAKLNREEGRQEAGIDPSARTVRRRADCQRRSVIPAGTEQPARDPVVQSLVDVCFRIRASDGTTWS